MPMSSFVEVVKMICQCEICKKVHPTGLDATQLAVFMGRMKEDEK